MSPAEKALRAVVANLKASRQLEIDTAYAGPRTAAGVVVPEARHSMPPMSRPLCSATFLGSVRSTPGRPISCPSCLDIILKDAHLALGDAADTLACGARYI